MPNPLTKLGRKVLIPTKLGDAPHPILRIAHSYEPTADVTLYSGDCRQLLEQIPNGEAQLIVTSPPYNIGKEYEKRVPVEEYVSQQSEVMGLCVRKLSRTGSICWEVGNYVDDGEIIPLDILLYPIFKQYGLKLRNRIVWHFGHGLHCSKRLSGRHEAILWFTKSDDYSFNLDPIRVPQKYPGKTRYKGPNRGSPSGNPLGKNPGDVWIFPNVKANHPEKTVHPCQFPAELVERLVLSMTEPGDLVLDPFIGVGTSAVAAVMHKRRAAGADTVKEYLRIAEQRILLAAEGRLPTRPMGKPLYEPTGREKVSKLPQEWLEEK